MQAHAFPTATEAKAFALAGNATLTLESKRTGVHFTYKVRAAKVDPRSTRQPIPSWFVSLLTGPDNENDYQYLGMIRDNKFVLTRASRAGLEAPSVKAFHYFWNCTNGVMPKELVVRHEGRCGRCGRTLTVPESIDLGIGPECLSKMGGAL